MKLCACNVRYGEGKDERYDLERIAGGVRADDSARGSDHPPVGMDADPQRRAQLHKNRVACSGGGA